MVVIIHVAQLVLAGLGVLLLAWECWLTWRGRPHTARAFRTWALAALGGFGLLAYTNFGRFNRGDFLHVWDTYHYYVGAKYFPELGYERLYECTAVADAESGQRREVATRTMTDLGTNQQVKTFDILARPEVCLRHFTAARWAEFKHDVGWFRDRAYRHTWRRIQRDHGYNATPVWTVAGHLLTNLAPASELQIGGLLLLDPLLILAAFVLLGRCFGWRVAALAGLMMGTYYPSEFYWTGGAFLRFDWLFCIIAGLCALRRDRPFLGGALLAGAALLRLFPAALLVGPAIAAVAHVVRTRRWNASHLRLFAGAAVAVALAVPPALVMTGDGGRGFVANTIKHADTPLTNNMGLSAVLSYRPDATVRALRAEAPDELWPRFREARRTALGAALPVLAVAGLALLALLWRAAAGELWRVTALALILVPALLQLTCYYYVFVIVWAVLAGGRPGIALVLVAMCAGSMAIALVVMPRVGMDESCIALSCVTLVGLGSALGLALRGRSSRSAPDEPGGHLLAERQ